VDLLPPEPLHLATLGMLDNQIGMATLGYVVLPEVVPRFPAEGIVEADGLIATFTEESLEATLQGIDWSAVATAALDVEGLLESVSWRVMLEAQDMEGKLSDDKPLQGEVEQEEDPWAEIAEDDTVAEVEDTDQVAEVEDADQVAEVVEKPGEGRCR